MHGHFRLNDVLRWSEGKADIISILRDPIQRYLSYYNFWKYKMGLEHMNKNFQRFRKDDAPFVDFIKYDFMNQEGFEYVHPDLKHKFKFIGTVKFFQASINTLASMYGKQSVPMGSKANVTSRQFNWDQLTPQEKEEVHAVVKEERDFYKEIEAMEGGWVQPEKEGDL